jgi:GDPmannose 4,6-dehydratase
VTNRRALITGITGQDGSYLAEFLLTKGYTVFGLVRRLSIPNSSNLSKIRDRIEVLDGDLMDQVSLNESVRTSEPTEVYNLGAQSYVGTSFAQPVVTGEITGLGALRMLEAVRTQAPEARFYQASSSEMFGNIPIEPQNESTPFRPRSPYGAAKLYAHSASILYREAYSMFVSNGILFNHESPRRGMEFVTRKISHGVAQISLGLAKKLTLGALEARRDWGYAPEYVELMWRILRHDRPDDFVGATGVSHTVREFLAAAFQVVGIDDWQRYVDSDDRFVRPAEVSHLRGDASKARKILGWAPKCSFADLVRVMVENDVHRLEGASAEATTGRSQDRAN